MGINFQMLNKDERIHCINRYLYKHSMNGSMLAVVTGLSSSAIYNFLKGCNISRDAALRMHRATGGELNYYDLCGIALRPEQEVMLQVQPRIVLRSKRRHKMPRMKNV